MGEVFDFLARGGPLMIPIGIGSVFALAIFLERMWALQESRISPSWLTSSVLEKVRAGDVKSARDTCLQSNTSLGRLLVAGIDARRRTRDDVKEVFEEHGRREVTRMERYIEALGTTASIEPLMGLLGTVTGMIQVFQKVVVTSREGAVDPGQLANGIWQALITTAAGLSVAIVAFIGYRYLLSRANRHAQRLEEGAANLLEVLHPLKSQPGAKEEE